GLDAVGERAQAALRFAGQRGLVELEAHRAPVAFLRAGLGDASPDLALLSARAVLVDVAGPHHAAVGDALAAGSAVLVLFTLVGHALAEGALLALAAVGIRRALGLGHALVTLADEAGLAVVVLAALLALPVDAD